MLKRLDKYSSYVLISNLAIVLTLVIQRVISKLEYGLLEIIIVLIIYFIIKIKVRNNQNNLKSKKTVKETIFYTAHQFMYISIFILFIYFFNRHLILKDYTILGHNCTEEYICSNYHDLLDSVKTEEILEEDRVAIKNYDPYKFTFGFRNFGSSDSRGGVCFGFAYFQKLYYTGELDTVLTDTDYVVPHLKGLDEIILDSEVLNRMYGKPITKNIDKAEYLMAKSIDNMSIESQYMILNNKVSDPYSNLTNEELGNLLNIINYIQKQQVVLPSSQYHNKIYENIISATQNMQYKILRRLLDINNLDKSFEISMITDKIDNDEPLVVGISNKIQGGHALFVYGYKKISKDIYYVYVQDSNIPLFNKQDEKYIAINKDIRYIKIIFKRDRKGEWQYIYNPKINNNYIYRGQYNSFLPEAILEIW
ncbi:hypothetical protein [Vallitalea guaymasensis]|uniref:hypothetical protein n=1 Tax=Vallitalea guaymasensis TaxID=1185412 RepID=UPI000DE3D2EC|nr:hypothetical protein [Vallitalea guaymasensis]